ncbi:MAG: HEAT repeat domain-containing protein [Candidatus Riflebacteria bacterium]|nr:HEAT repeat domain-containing protein [Candidatus Riflebacteria bacterium]
MSLNKLMQEIFQTLDAPIKSFRIFAIEKAIQEGSSNELLEILKKRQNEETDEECLILLTHAVVSVTNRISTSSANGFANLTSENFINTFLSTQPTERLNILNSLSSAQIQEFAVNTPNLLANETNPAILASLVRKFGPHWPPEKLDSLKELLFSKFLSVRLSALEILTSRHPESVIQDLPKFLSSTDPRIRSLAIQGLSRIDMESAIEHLETMLMTSNPDEKLCGLQNCLYLPFEKIKSLLIKFLASEISPQLLEKAGFLIQMNPDQEIPFQLLELMGRAPRNKLDFLKKVFSGSCQGIENSKILGDSFHAYMEHVMAFGKKANATRYAQEVLSKLSTITSDQELYEEFSSLRDSDNPEIINSLKDSLQWDISPELKQKVSKLLEYMEKPAPLEKSADKPFSLEELSPKEAIRTFSLLQREQIEKFSPILKEVISNADSNINVLASAIKTARRLELDSFTSIVEPFLNSADEKLTVAAMEYVAQFEPDKIFPLMGYYLQSQSPRIKSVAIAIFKRFDFNRALSSLKALLSLENPEQKKMAILCMLQFDFPFIRSLLVDFLLNNKDPDLLELGLCLFQTNPDPENLYYLFCLEKKLPKQFNGKIQKARLTTEKTLIELGLLKEGQINTSDRVFLQRFSNDENKANEIPKPYSIQEIRKHNPLNSDDANFSQTPQNSLIIDFFTQFAFTAEQVFGKSWKLFAFISIIFFPLLYIVFETIFQNQVKAINPPKSPISQNPDRTRNPPQDSTDTKKTIIAQVLTVGKAGTEILVKGDDGKNYLLLIPKKSKWRFSSGEVLKISIVSFRADDKGVIIVQSFQFEKVSWNKKK